MEGESKANKAKAKAEARKAWNKAQANEERHIWAQVNAQADNMVEAYKGRKGPPSTYTEEIGNEIVLRLSCGQSLSSICKTMEGAPHIATIYDWIKNHPSFGERYAHARENAAHTLFDQMLDIADDSSRDLLKDGSANNAAIARARLQIETRARVAGKLHVKVYGERVEQFAQTVNVTNNTLAIDGRALDGDQRAALRSMLLQAQGKTIDSA